MDRRTLEQYLAQAEDHIDDARRRIERQTSVVEQLKAAGRGTEDAQELLEQFGWSLQTTLADRELLLRLLKKA